MTQLVSIITPCYNGEAYIGRFLDSVLNQTYKNIELILIDDGSKDKTADIIKSYIDKFKENSMELRYVFQENAGQAQAMNTGLKLFKGDYLTWVDSDDIMMKDNIEKKVDFLNENEEYGFVLCQAELVKEDNLEASVGILKREQPKGEDTIFRDFIYSRNVVYGPGTILVRKSAVERAIPTKEIYPSREGQNWQMMLPISYTSKCGYINEPLVKVVLTANSHSRQKRSYEKILKRENEFINICSITIENIPDMPANEKAEYLKEVKVFHLRKLLSEACLSFDFEKISAYRKELKAEGVEIGKYGYILPNFIRKIYNKIK